MNEQIVIPLLAGLAATAIGGAVLMAKRSRRAPMQERLRNLEQRPSAATASGAAATAKASRLHDIAASVGSAISKGESSRSLQEQLSQTGYHHPHAAARYLGIKA